MCNSDGGAASVGPTPRRTLRSVTMSLVALSVLVTAGCGESIVLVPVSGLVYKGPNPVENAIVEFMPKEGRSSYAKSNAAGEFEMTTGVGKVGVPPGVYDVIISTPEPKDAPKAPDATSRDEGGRPEMQGGGMTAYDPEKFEYRLKNPVTITDGAPPEPFEWDLDVIESKDE